MIKMLALVVFVVLSSVLFTGCASSIMKIKVDTGVSKEEHEAVKGRIEEFYGNNPQLIEDQRLKQKNVLKFLDDNNIKYYRYHDLAQIYVNVTGQIFLGKCSGAGGMKSGKATGGEECVVRMNLRSGLSKDIIAVYVFGSLGGSAYIHAPYVFSIIERTVEITGHTFYGRLNINRTETYWAETSIAMDSYTIASRIMPYPNGTWVNSLDTYVVPASSFRGKESGLHTEFQNLLDLLVKLGGRGETNKNIMGADDILKKQ